MKSKLVTLLVYAVLPALLLANLWCFQRFFDTSYLQWYLDKGPIISLSLGFIALIWEELDARKGLLSANPVYYLGTCLALAGILAHALGVQMESNKRRDAAAHGWSVFGQLWDLLVTVVVGMAIIVLLFAWILVVAPLNYVVTLFAGAPARMQLRGLAYRSMVIEANGRIEIIKAPTNTATDEKAVDVSFARKPFAVTQALTALMLWGANALLPHIPSVF